MVVQKQNANVQNLICGYEKILSAYSPSLIDTLFFTKNYMLLWSVGGFVSLLKHVRILVKEHQDYFSLTPFRKNYVGLSSSSQIEDT